MRRLILFLSFLCVAPLARAQSLFDSTYAIQQAAVYFDFGKADLTPAAGVVLDSLATSLRANPAALFIRITAHTDSIGSAPANKLLSSRRAEAVRAGLAARGLAEAQIELAGEGEGRPVAANDTETGRQQNRRATLEIMQAVPMSTLSGQIRDPETGKGIPQALVTFRSKTRQDSTRTDSNGFYSARLPKDSIVKMEAQALGYIFQEKAMKVFGSPELYKKYKINPDIELKQARAGEKAVLRDLFFVGNEAVLLKVSEPELPKVLRFLQINPALQVEIAGHINHPGVKPENLAKWEWELSVNRAKLVYDYLLASGIPEARLRYKGYGNTEMIFPDPGSTEEQQQQNRRVEVRVLSQK
ncbi:MAG: OmpA family protein [Saprospiraceae bacterium]